MDIFSHTHLSTVVKYLPSWFPGAAFQVLGKKGKELRVHSMNEPFDMVFEQVVSSFANLLQRHQLTPLVQREGRVESLSYTSRLLEAKGGANSNQEDISLIKSTAGSMFTGMHLVVMLVQPN